MERNFQGNQDPDFRLLVIQIQIQMLETRLDNLRTNTNYSVRAAPDHVARRDDHNVRLNPHRPYATPVSSIYNVPTNAGHRALGSNTSASGPQIQPRVSSFGSNTRAYVPQNQPPVSGANTSAYSSANGDTHINHPIASCYCPCCPAAGAYVQNQHSVSDQDTSIDHAVASCYCPSCSAVGAYVQNQHSVSEYTSINHPVASYNCPAAGAYDQNQHSVSEFSGGRGMEFYDYQQMPSLDYGYSTADAPPNYFMAPANGFQSQQPTSDFDTSVDSNLIGAGANDFQNQHLVPDYYSGSGTEFYDSQQMPSSDNGYYPAGHAPPNFLAHANGFETQQSISGISVVGGSSNYSSTRRTHPSANFTIPPNGLRGNVSESDNRIPPYNMALHSGSNTSGGASDFYTSHRHHNQIPSANHHIEARRVNNINMVSDAQPSTYSQVPPPLPPSTYYPREHDNINPSHNSTDNMSRTSGPYDFIEGNRYYQSFEEFMRNDHNHQCYLDEVSPIDYINQQIEMQLAAISLAQALMDEYVDDEASGLSEETINRHLKTRAYNPSKTKDGDANICAVCLDDFESQEKIGNLQCGHGYHAECIREWLLRKNVCPMCKAPALII